MRTLSLLISLALLVLGQNASETPVPVITPPIPTTPAPTTSVPTTTAPTTPPPPPPTTPVPPPPPTTTVPVTDPPTTTVPTTSPPTAPPTTTVPTTTPAPPTTPPTTKPPTTTTTTTKPVTTTTAPVTTTATTQPATTTPTTTEPTSPPTTTEANSNSNTTTAPTAKPEKANDTPAPSLRQEESKSSSKTVWIILGSVVGVLVAGVACIFLMKRSKKDEGHDDDVISNYGGHHSSPNIGFMTGPKSLSFDQQSIPAVVSPAPLQEVAIVDRSQVVADEEQYLSDMDIPRHSEPSSEAYERRVFDSARSPNLWQSAMTSTPQARAAPESEAFHSTLSDSYSIGPSMSSEEQSESFVSKYSSSYEAQSTKHHI